MVELSKFDPVGAKAVDVFKFQDEVADCLIVLMQMAHFSDSEIVDDGFIGVRSRVEEKLYRLEERIINNRPDDHIWIEDVGEDNVGMGE